jgi:hypothetical protein
VEREGLSIAKWVCKSAARWPRTSARRSGWRPRRPVSGDRRVSLLNRRPEKYLKALLVRSQVEFPKTHDIAKLLDRVAAVDAGAAERLRGADALTPFGVEARYPSDAPEVLPGGEIEAIGLARTVGNVVMASLQPYLDKPER